METERERETNREDKETPEKKKKNTERETERDRERERDTAKKKGGNIPVGTCMLLDHMDLAVGLVDTSSIMPLPLPT